MRMVARSYVSQVILKVRCNISHLSGLFGNDCMAVIINKLHFTSPPQGLQLALHVIESEERIHLAQQHQRRHVASYHTRIRVVRVIVTGIPVRAYHTRNMALVYALLPVWTAFLGTASIPRKK